MKSNRTTFLITIFIIALVALIYILAPYASVFVLAIVFGVVFTPVHTYLLRKTKSPALAALLATIFIIVLIVGPFAFIVTKIIKESIDADVGIDAGSLNHIVTFIQGKVTFLHVDINNLAKQGAQWVITKSGNIFSGAASVVANLFLASIAIYYWYKDGAKLRTTLIDASPLRDTDDRKILSILENSVRSVMSGTLIVAASQGIIAGIGFTIFGVPHSVIWGTLVAFTALIPTVGTSIVLIPAILYLWISGNTVNAIGLLVWGVLAVGLIDNFLGPKLISRGNSMHPFFILMSIIGGVTALGPIGILAGPLILAVFQALLKIYSEHQEKNIEENKLPHNLTT